MLVRFLNNMSPDQDSTGKSGGMPISCENWLKLVNPYELTVDRFEEVLEKNQFKFLSSHPLWVLYNKDYRDLLKKHNYEIWSIKVEPKHHVTILIEGLLKNMPLDRDKANFILKNKLHPHNINILNASFFEDHQKLDIQNLQNKRIKRVRNILKNTTSHLYEMRACFHRLFNEMIEDRTLLHYQHLYLQEYPFPYMPDREKEWYGLVNNSWCDYNEHGYRKFEEPKVEWREIVRKNNEYTQTVIRYLEQWKNLD